MFSSSPSIASEEFIISLITALALEGLESSQIFAIYSVGVLAVSSLLAALIFKEKLSRQ